jgi:hypothetical protein
MVENRLAERPGLWKRPLKAVKFMKISDLTIIRTDFLDQAKKWLLKIKHLSDLFGGKLTKKRGPQNEGISRHLDENKGPVFHSPLSKPSS